MAFDFRGEVTSRGGEFKPFSHTAFMDQKPNLMKRGHCFGLTAVWLSRYVRERKSAGVDKLSGLSFTKASTDPQTIMIIRQIQNMANSEAMTQNMVTPGRSDASKAKAAEFQGKIDAAFGDSCDRILTEVMKALGVTGITFYGVPMTGTEMTSSLLVLIRRLEHSLYGIQFMNHIVGAIVDKKKDVFKFIDVNYGQGVWKGVTAGGSGFVPFLSFLEAYLADKSIRLDYSDGKIQGTLGYCNAVIPYD